MTRSNLRPLSAATTVVGVIGDPVGHSLSPLIHNTAFAAMDLDWVSVGFPTRSGDTRSAVEGLSALGIAGVSVTMPHKEAVIAHLERVSPDAEVLGAVNCIARDGDDLVGLNTDGEGFIRGLRHDFAMDAAGSRCAVIGAGGAARSIVLALDRHRAENIVVINRTPQNAARAAAVSERATVGSVKDLAGCDLVVNSTPIGMSDTSNFADDGTLYPCDPTLIREGQLVVDLIYNPITTAWLVAAESQGARTSNGISMLVFQAALALEEWTGEIPPVEALTAAVGREVERRLSAETTGTQSKS